MGTFSYPHRGDFRRRHTLGNRKCAGGYRLHVYVFAGKLAERIRRSPVSTHPVRTCRRECGGGRPWNSPRQDGGNRHSHDCNFRRRRRPRPARRVHPGGRATGGRSRAPAIGANPRAAVQPSNLIHRFQSLSTTVADSDDLQSRVRSRGDSGILLPLSTIRRTGQTSFCAKHIIGGQTTPIPVVAGKICGFHGRVELLAGGNRHGHSDQARWTRWDPGFRF